jgi:DNA polymerase III subunit delta
MALLSREDLRNQLKNDRIAPVYLLFGKETFLRDSAVKAITERVLKDAPLREFNESSFSLAETDIQQILATAEQLPMIAARRIVQVSQLNKMQREADEEVLARYVARPAESCVLILIADELDKRRKLAKILLENCTAIEFAPLEQPELLQWARRTLKDSNADADEKALQHLIGLVGDNLRLLTNELKKLVTASLPSGRITFDLVDELVANSRELSNFELTDHLVARNSRRALEILQKILDDGAEPLMLLGLIASNYRRLAWAKEAMARGADREEVFRSIKLPYNKREEFLATARRADSEKLARCLERIADADLAIKSSLGGGGASGARLQIEMLVCELANS